MSALQTKSSEAARRMVTEYGRKAFASGRAYESNPYPPNQPSYRLWWSEGFKAAEAEAQP